MALTVVSVGYSLAAVSPDSAGGAEQILSTLDRALVEAGHRSIVIALEGSSTAGELRTVPAPDGTLDDAVKARMQGELRRRLEETLRQEPVNLVHMHGLDFHACLPPAAVPVLATLHLPVDWYPIEAIRPFRPETWVHCVSEAQHAVCPPSPNLLPPIPNGIPVGALQARHAKRRFALYLGRICPEKGVHLAIEAARQADLPLIIAGQLFPYEAHERYFDEMVRPHLGPACRFVGPVGFARKRRLLTGARCLLVPSLAAETSSLVAREAAACGTAVIAFPNGAMSDTVEEGRTGFLVQDVNQMAAAIERWRDIDPWTCRTVAERRFSDRLMTERYFDVYARLMRPNA